MFRKTKQKPEEVMILPLPALEMREVERCFARIFLSEDGKKALGYLQATTFHRALSAGASDAELRHMEGQRALVAKIERLIGNGRKG